MPPETRRAGSAAVGDARPTVPSVHKGVFRKEGEYWTVGFDGNSFRLKDTKGLGYIAHLLRHPAVEFHVLDLAGGIGNQRDDDEMSLPRGEEDLEKAGIHIGSLGDAGEMLDDQAKAAYRHRLSDLREELEEAKERGNVERAEQAEQEIDALTRELSRAVGLGGRNRRAVSASERARQSIGKTIKAVLDRIAPSDGALGDILSRCIRTGTFCSYQPDADFPIAWEFAAAAAEPDHESASNDEPAPARADHPQTSPLMLEVSSFSLAERTAFVGRETEGGAIRAVIDRARAGHGSIVMLWDGPGVGKTRLAMEMAEYASSKGFRCSVGHCYERDEPHPYLPFAEIIENNLAQAASLEDYRRQIGPNAAEIAQIAPSLRRVFPDIPQPLELPPAQQRHYLFQSFSETLARTARTRANIYLLEDLHWADESTLALFIYLARRIAQLPVVIIGTYRSGYSDYNPALVRTLEELIRMGVRPQKLAGLPKDVVGQMLQELSQRQAPERLVDLIFEESQGYPFFVEEVYRHLIEEGKVFDAGGQFRTDLKLNDSDVPETVRLVISRRLERLDESEKRVLAAAAVIGRSFSFRLLTEVSQTDVDELFTVIEKAQRMGTIVPSSEGPETPFTFAHELVRQTLLNVISPPRRQRLHAAAAAAIERLNPGAKDEYAGEIAHHLVKAGSFADRLTLARWQTQAGRNALSAAAFEEARANFESALSLADTIDTRERANLLASIAIAEMGLGRWEAAHANLRKALEIHIKMGDREMMGASFSELAQALISAGRFDEAAEIAQRGLTHLQGDISAYRVYLFAALAEARAMGPDRHLAEESWRAALELSAQLSDPKVMGRALGARSVAYYQWFRLREAAEDGLRSEQLGGMETAPWPGALQLLILIGALLYLGRLDEAARIADALEPLCRKIGQSQWVAICSFTRTWMELGAAPQLAKFDNVLQQLAALARGTRSAFWDALLDIQFSLLNYFRGDWTTALQHAKAACRHDSGISMEGFGAGILFRHLAYAGERAEALAFLDQTRKFLPTAGQHNARGSWLLLASVVEGLLMLGEEGLTAQLYPLTLELIDTGAVALWPIWRLTQTAAGIAASAAHQYEAAEQHFRTAMRHAESLPHLLEQAEISRFHAMMLVDRAGLGDRAKAQTLLREALESYTQIGMPRHIEITQTLLARATGDKSEL